MIAARAPEDARGGAELLAELLAASFVSLPGKKGNSIYSSSALATGVAASSGL